MRSWFGGKGTAIAAFGLVAALVLGGLWWMTEAALRLEAEQGEVRAAVDLNSRLRIALWRLDGRISPVLAQESARPFEHYSAVYVPAAALDAHGAAWPAGAILEPSPLLDAALPSWLTLHFQFQPDARVVSPQAPPEALLERLREAEVAVGNVTPIKQAALADLQAVLDPVRLTALLPPPKVEPSLPVPPGELVYQTAANAPPAFEPNAEGNVELQQALSPSQTPDADPFQQSGQTAPVSPSGPGGSAGGGDETGATSHPNAASLPQPPGTQPPTYTTRTVPPGAFPSGASGGMSADDPGRGGSA
ncbi:MAG TPA: hypothetical protein VGE52_20395, partial [Pirellulales bacterium]